VRQSHDLHVIISLEIDQEERKASQWKAANESAESTHALSNILESRTDHGDG
jgi:hypothetical protein